MLNISRYERKYASALSPAQLHQQIQNNLAMFHEVYYPRRVTSLYFDTPDFTLLEQNLNGEPQRVKVRVRWYQKPHDSWQTIPKEIQLEIKQRDNDLISKQTSVFTKQELSKIEATNPEKWLENVTNLVQQKIQTQLPYAHSLQPSLCNSYIRTYYFSEQLGMRITLDESLVFSQPIDWLQKKYQHEFLENIVECKYSVATDTQLRNVIQSMPLHISRFSKYVIGSQISNQAIILN